MVYNDIITSTFYHYFFKHQNLDRKKMMVKRLFNLAKERQYFL